MKTIMLVLMGTLLLSACNTMAGMGQDVSAAGSAVSNAADDVKAKM
ncbi:MULTISPECIES: entericidin A/B family lipoprotein [Crenobacter]|uniref:Entericidin A/B family lipoprotein n=2 Tax=Crenobacter TaxID=1654931 RepID=A0A4T0UU73_9NEIS|nr:MULTISPECIES: entericidin A/B family lipoprotein [Crenobacter]NDV11733.1 entericidin A/B family lipoprotein [Crenobacter caeni]TIC82125.1 entericidin A/B family lipoprotein [Crenobacter intestini]